jgi:hypothetical protein
MRLYNVIHFYVSTGLVPVDLMNPERRGQTLYESFLDITDAAVRNKKTGFPDTSIRRRHPVIQPTVTEKYLIVFAGRKGPVNSLHRLRPVGFSSPNQSKID